MLLVVVVVVIDVVVVMAWRIRMMLLLLLLISVTVVASTRSISIIGSHGGQRVSTTTRIASFAVVARHDGWLPNTIKSKEKNEPGRWWLVFVRSFSCVAYIFWMD